MTNRIRSVEIDNRSLDPASAEVWLTVTPEQQTPTTEIRGKLLGPHCPYSSTVEIAYPFRPVRPEQQAVGALRVRASIPEASLWDPQSPFLYTVLVELWQDGQRCEQKRLTHGLRDFALTPKGVVVNGKVFRLQGRHLDETLPPEPGTALRLRQEGCNLLVGPVTTAAWWDVADVYGLLLLGEITEISDTTLAAMQKLSARASCLGWLAPATLLPRLLEWTPQLWLACAWHEGTQPPTIEPRFVVGPAALRASSPLAALPWLFEGEAGTGWSLGQITP